MLLTAGGVAKVTDFGLAVAAPEDTKAGGSLTAETGTYRYMAPEVICHERYSKTADIFSFGCLLFELSAPDALRRSSRCGGSGGRPQRPAPRCPRTPTPLRSSSTRAGCARRPSASFRHVHAQLVAAALDAAQTAWLDEPAGHRIRRARVRSVGWRDAAGLAADANACTAAEAASSRPALPRAAGCRDCRRRSARWRASDDDGKPSLNHHHCSNVGASASRRHIIFTGFLGTFWSMSRSSF